MQHWNIQYLNELYNKYYKLSVQCEDVTQALEYESTANSILNIIDRYDELCDEALNPDISQRRDSFRYIIEDDFNILDNYGIYCPYIRRLNEYGEESSGLRINPNSDLPVIDTSVSRILTVSDDFYKGISGVFYEKYTKMARTFGDTLHIRELTPGILTNGQTYSVYKTDIVFVELGVNKTSQDYISAIHEFGHGISCAINSTAMFDFAKYCFIEIDALFFELLGLDYINRELKLEKDGFDISMQILKDYLYSAQLICDKMDMYDVLSQKQLYKKSSVKRYLANEVGYDEIGINDMLYTPMRDYFHYIISYLTAIELYIIYQSNQAIALDLLFKIIRYETTFSIGYLEYIKSLGLEPGKSFEVYLEMLFNKAKDLKDEKSLRYKN